MFASQFLKKKKSQTLNRNVNKIFFDDIPRHFDTANLLGRGSYGTVYKAIIDDGNPVVAVKVLHGESIQSLKSCKRECQILSGLIKHSNLVRMTGSAWSSQFMAVVLEYVGNGNLEQHLYPRGSEIGSCKLKMRDRLGIASRCCPWIGISTRVLFGSSHTL